MVSPRQPPGEASGLATSMANNKIKLKNQQKNEFEVPSKAMAHKLIKNLLKKIKFMKNEGKSPI